MVQPAQLQSCAVLVNYMQGINPHTFLQRNCFGILLCAFDLQPDHVAKGFCPRIPGERLPASYINHYVANGGAIVPRFGGYSADRDAEAVRILQEAYGPERKVVNVYSREILLNAGNVHCITQQNPAPRN